MSRVEVRQIGHVAVAPVAETLSVKGRGQTRVALTGISNARWKDADLGNPSAEIRFEGRNAVVAVDAPELALKGNGSIGVDTRGTLAVRGEWTPNDVAAIAQRLRVAPSTPVSGSAEVAERSFSVNGTAQARGNRQVRIGDADDRLEGDIAGRQVR